MGDASSRLMKPPAGDVPLQEGSNPAGRTLQYGLIAEEVAEV